MQTMKVLDTYTDQDTFRMHLAAYHDITVPEGVDVFRMVRIHDADPRLTHEHRAPTVLEMVKDLADTAYNQGFNDGFRNEYIGDSGIPQALLRLIDPSLQIDNIAKAVIARLGTARTGQKIEAVKEVRKQGDFGLKESYDAVNRALS